MTRITDPITLPCGIELPNRLAKAAMTEGLADPQNRATDRHLNLYNYWAASHVGLSLSGNIHVDRRYLERVGNVAVDGNGGLDELKAMAAAGSQNGTQFWAQISHAGRQSPADICAEPLAPSASAVHMPGAEFNTPRAATEDDIADVIERFVHAAETARACGFGGIQVHAAHGYLLSEFLSPLTNQRNDRWGGSLENRARLLTEIVTRVRKAVGPAFPIAVKLNSADFQKGGFSPEDSREVLRMLDDLGVDLVELSGGNYEDPVLLFGDNDANGRPVRESTRQREAYFLDFAREAREVWQKPLMVTGGFRTAKAMNVALAAGELDMIGIGRPLVGDPACTARLLDGSADSLPRFEDRLQPVGPDALPELDEATRLTANTFGHLGWFYMNIFRIGDGESPAIDATMLDSIQQFPPLEQAVVERWESPWQSA
ncbi:NADH:flavin oxidoreductase/NADH oxidase family protein [Spectribacter hydrogenoxidans]|uniref:NADH:flavin oxidoreductase/NADH oxidase family protein n=1 Tax=Spectribacter hydrogenoxidans TaxID=3075608 RepID=A0ABU3BYS7_9GAMM|nr:NADH:flavin oxidoreductase/NADH oxidase family protein [Salinisphaera sp. W335]MDT0634470.1 NADH:flavin oxidoreductase/NADH oxidase family protein [Salinisphaera sp. W335]